MVKFFSLKANTCISIFSNKKDKNPHFKQHKIFRMLLPVIKSTLLNELIYMYGNYLSLIFKLLLQLNAAITLIIIQA